MQYKSIFISDVHLGTRGCKAKLLISFLKNNDCEKLYLVGDIVDGWRLKKKFFWPQEHSNVVRKILTKAKQGTKVIWIAGNHDEFLRSWIKYNLRFGRIKIVNRCDHYGVDGKKYLVIHGDLFDGITVMHKWVALLGDMAYDFLLRINTHFNNFRRFFGMPYWSLSKFLKSKAKKAVNFINNYEKTITSYAHKKGYDGVICGHIHCAAKKTIDNTLYYNSGDWVESCTALVEHNDGTWEIIEWKES